MKINDKSFQYIQKTLFLARFWSIFLIFGAKNSFQKIWLCHAQLHMGFQHHAKIQKKLMIQFQENAQTDGRTDEQKDGLKDGQALFYRTLPATARGSIIIIKTVMQHKSSKLFIFYISTLFLNLYHNNRTVLMHLLLLWYHQSLYATSILKQVH